MGVHQSPTTCPPFIFERSFALNRKLPRAAWILIAMMPGIVLGYTSLVIIAATLDQFNIPEAVCC